MADAASRLELACGAGASLEAISNTSFVAMHWTKWFREYMAARPADDVTANLRDLFLPKT
jgi:hypothetical protein